MGGTAAASANTIAFNGLDGVAISVEGGTGNRVLSNSIFSNGDFSAPRTVVQGPINRPPTSLPEPIPPTPLPEGS